MLKSGTIRVEKGRFLHGFEIEDEAVGTALGYQRSARAFTDSSKRRTENFLNFHTTTDY